jgi:uncharacterized repeat protein (TIGR01451 family)
MVVTVNNFNGGSENLSVSLIANPYSACSSLNNVDLTASVSGNVTGNITYKFDCTSNGTWDKTITTSDTSYTAVDLCDYTAGNYTAKVRAERGGYSAENTTPIYVSVSCGGPIYYNHDLSVSLSASDYSGCKPLKNVDLTADVDSDISGYTTYYFDCDNDGSWDKDVSLRSDSYTASNVCNYYSSGTYIAKVKVARGGKTAEDTITIRVNSCSVLGSNAMSVEKLVSNLSDGTAYSESVAADPGEVVSFSIKIKSGSESLKNVIVRDSLPAGLTYRAGSLTINGVSSSKDITAGVNLGNIAANDTKTLVFKADVKSASNFSYGENTLINVVVVSSTNQANTDTAKVVVTRSSVLGAATGIVTGLTNNILLDSIVIPLAVALLLVWLFRNKIVKFEEWFDSRKKEYFTYKSDKVLRGKIMKARIKEILGKKIM